MIAIDWESGTPAEKTGRSGAIRCRGCGEITVADEYSVGEPGQVYIYDDRFDVSHFLVCRLCASQCLPPANFRPIGWEQFDYAVASDELIEKTNSSVRDEPAESDSRIRPRRCPDDIPRPALALLYSFQAYPARTDIVGGLIMGFTVILGVVLWLLLTGPFGQSEWFTAQISVGVLAVGAWIAYQVHLWRRDRYVAGVLAPWAERFLLETNADYATLLAHAESVRGFPRARGVVKALRADLADLPALQQVSPPVEGVAAHYSAPPADPAKAPNG